MKKWIKNNTEKVTITLILLALVSIIGAVLLEGLDTPIKNSVGFWLFVFFGLSAFGNLFYRILKL